MIRTKGVSKATLVTSRESPTLVIAIGASAGGLEAFTQFLGRLPADTGFGYVLVQHLDPTHESILAELLGRGAHIPVLQAIDRQRVEPDHAYVIPPDTEMTMTDGHLRLAPRKRGGPARSIDLFFRSIAEVHGSHSIGVVLSGTGSDGASGIEAIKAAGGITFAQDPESAGHDGMPRAAAATGCVDFVMPPADIATQLARISRNQYLHRADGLLPAPAADPLDPLFEIIRQRTGVDFAQYKIGTVQRRILRRMTLSNVDELTDYIDLLRTDTTEVDALYGDLLINVTRFFRQPELFTALSESVFPEMLKRREPGGSIRIWVPGCATGQEAFSVAIGLVESLGNAPTVTPIQVFGTDLSKAAVSMARAGLYPRSIEADVSPERLRRFFVKEAHGYRVAKAIRELCIFAPQNIASDPPFSQLDLISCRNVLIYLQPVLHKRILALFHYALKPDGILVLGNSESIDSAAGLFSPIDKKLRVYARHATVGRPPYLDFRLSSKIRTPRDAPTIAPARSRSVQEVQRAADQIVLGSYAPAGVVIDDQLQVLQFRGQTGAYLQPAAGTASFDLMGMARHDLRAELRDAIRTASEKVEIVRAESIPIHDGASVRYADIEVIPFKVISSDAQLFVVLFEDIDHATAIRRRARQRRVHRRGDEKQVEFHGDGGAPGELVQELDAARRRLHEIAEEHGFAIGELQVANEEVQSTNEELQSTNEELETAKEELQSANEELATLNDELRDRNGELGSLNDDLTNLLTSMHVPAVIVGTDLRVRRFTTGAESLMNIVPTDVGRRIGDLNGNVDIAELENLIAEVIDTRDVREREVRDSSGRWYSVVIRPYRTANDTISGAVIVFQDIDERQHHAQRLDEARRHANAIVETVRDPLLVLDPQLRVQRANRAFYEMFKTNPAETERRSLFELGDGQWDIPPLRILRDEPVPNEILFAGLEFEHAFPTIGRRVVCLSGRHIILDDGGDPLMLLAIEDITARRDFERRTRFLTEAAAGFATSVGYDATVEAIGTIAVPAFADSCTIDLSQPDGTICRTQMASRDRDPADFEQPHGGQAVIAPEPAVSAVLATGESFLLEEVPPSYLDSGAWDGEDLARLRAFDPGSLLIVPLRAGTHSLGVITLAVTRSGAARRYGPDDLAVAEEFARRAALALERAAHYRDMATARRAAEAANRVKADFLATMSHELRTPLNAILGYVQLFELEISGKVTDAQRDYLRRITSSQQHLLGLIEDVLQFAKIEAGHVDFHLTEISVNEVLMEAAGLAVPQMQRKELHYDFRPCDDTMCVRADRGRVRQVVLNLLSNAMKFTNAGGRITVECTPSEVDAVIRVTDTGIGIPSDKLELVFEPFFQLDSKLTRKADGTGLGLAISRSFAREMGGDLTAASVVGEGTTFSFRLPRAPQLDADAGVSE
jgi:two-component system, chemotaxis family, CheB/CheR fusion protein